MGGYNAAKGLILREITELSKFFSFKYIEIMSMKRDCNFDFYLISKFNQYYNVNYSILGFWCFNNELHYLESIFTFVECYNHISILKYKYMFNIQ